jgi:dihydroorotate dehydrogenase electron transfer subunit
MLARILEIADERDIDVQLSFERYMKCGIGICGQCCLDGSGIRVCVEGPVLRREEIRETTEIGLPHRDATGTRKTS